MALKSFRLLFIWFVWNFFKKCVLFGQIDNPIMLLLEQIWRTQFLRIDCIWKCPFTFFSVSVTMSGYQSFLLLVLLSFEEEFLLLFFFLFTSYFTSCPFFFQSSSHFIFSIFNLNFQLFSLSPEFTVWVLWSLTQSSFQLFLVLFLPSLSFWAYGHFTLKHQLSSDHQS